MAGMYAEYAREFAKVKKNRAIEWLTIKGEKQKEGKITNAEVDMLWEASPSGQRYNELKALMDGLSKQLTAEADHLRVLGIFGL